MKTRRRRYVPAAKSKAENDQPYACYLCFMGPRDRYFVPIAFTSLPQKLKRIAGIPSETEEPR